MKRLILVILAAWLSLGASQNPRLAYIEKYSALAVEEMERTGVPASITLAQGMLESAAGQSLLATKGNNHFGIKCHNDWTGKSMRQDDDQRNECFRVYKSVEQSFRDHSDFLRGRDRYKDLFELEVTDYKGWARGLKKAGYATDPSYANKLIELIEDYNLHRFDRADESGKAKSKSKEKAKLKTPKQLETPRKIEKQELEMEYRERHSFSFERDLYEQNGVPFIYARDGESFSSIASAHGLFLKELLRYNDLSEIRELTPGNVVYLAAKKSRAPEGVSKYVVDRQGETLYEISQRFGIRLKTLENLNPVLRGVELSEGDTVLLSTK